jgi:hypothetical protein
MTENVRSRSSSPSEGPQSERAQGALQVAERCLELIEIYRKGDRTPLAKVAVIRDVTATITAATPQFAEADVNDALGSYLDIITQSDPPAATTGRGNSETVESGTLDQPTIGSKRVSSPGPVAPNKRHRPDESEYPWSIREGLSGPGLCDDLQRTLELLRLYAKDLKFAKSSILTAADAPQFPNSEWSNIIVGAMVDLDRVISGSFAISSDNREVEVIGGLQLKFGAAKPAKQVKTSGDWFIAWRLYTQAVTFAFPHRRSELDSYGVQVLALFAATSPANHPYIISLDKAIRVRVGERRDLLLSDNTKFDDLRLFWLNPIGAGSQGTDAKVKEKGKTSFRSEEACDRWNRGVCRSKNAECKYQHVCQECRGPHKVDECGKSKKGRD